jgi:hypothetical protein
VGRAVMDDDLELESHESLVLACREYRRDGENLLKRCSEQKARIEALEALLREVHLVGNDIYTTGDEVAWIARRNEALG